MTSYALWYERGLAAGERLKDGIAHNLERFAHVAQITGYDFNRLMNQAVRSQKRIPAHLLAEIRGMAETSALSLEALLAYNLYSEVIEPEGCTVAMAMPDVTAGGNLLFMKNSDKRGTAQGPPEVWHANKEVNVVRIVEPDPRLGTHKVIGFTAVGKTFFKMGVNDRGVASGGSLARISKSSDKDASYFGAAGRAEYMRDALLQAGSAEEAACQTLPRLLSGPVASPGNIQYADVRLATNLECSFSELAALWIDKGIMVRTNSFELMSSLNRQDDVSSVLRRERVTTLLEACRGTIDVEVMKAVSMDHGNGPGVNSVCRHSDDWDDETSLGAAVMRVIRDDPLNSEIHIAMGKPCHAWQTAEGEGWIKLTMRTTEADIPQAFLTGDVWRRYYSEHPNRAPSRSDQSSQAKL